MPPDSTTQPANDWLLALPWVAVALGIFVFLAARGFLRGDVLRRGPLREIELTHADLVLGFGFVAMLFLDKVLVRALGGVIDWSMRMAQGIELVASMAIPAGAAFFVAKAYMSEAGFRRAGLLPRRPGRDILYTALGLPVAVLLTLGTLNLVNLVASQLGHPSPTVNHGMLTQLQAAKNNAEVAAIIILAVGVAPLLEELVFRGLLQTLLLEALGRPRRWTTVLIASALFASVHLGAVSWHALPGLFVLAVVLGWLYERTGSLLPCVVIHAAFNALNIAVVLMMRQAGM